jgi:rod shape-determining protein MreC
MLFPKKNQPIVVVSIFIVLSLIILTFSVKRPFENSFIRKLVLETAYPLEDGITGGLFTLRDAWKRYIFLIGLGEENTRLKKENRLLQERLIQYQEGYFEAQRLQKLLALKENVDRNGIAARVIDQNQASLFKTILINRGSANGIKVGLPVISDRGVVGRIIETSWHTARVLLLIDEKSNIDAAVQASRAQGILQGSGVSGCHLKYVSTLEDIKAGDVVISSGIAGIFPKGLLLGTVNRVDKKEGGLFQKIIVTPAVDFSSLEEVLVLGKTKEP